MKAILKIQRLIVDVDLTIQNGTAPLTGFRLLLPFSAEEDWQWRKFDYSPAPAFALKVDDSSADLIGEEDRRILGGGHTYTVQTVTIGSDPIAAGAMARFAIRYYVYPPTSLVKWKRSGFGISGALFELGSSISPTRSSGALASLLSAAPAINTSDLIVVARTSLQMRFSSPTHLEPTAIDGRAWESYLQRWTDYRREGALIAYRSRQLPGDDESSGPHRLFLDMSREFGLLPIGNFIRTSLCVLLIVVIARWTGLIPSGPSSGIHWEAVGHWIGTHVPAVTPVGAALLIGLWLSRVKTPRTAFRRFDRWTWTVIQGGFGRSDRSPKLEQGGFE